VEVLTINKPINVAIAAKKNSVFVVHVVNVADFHVDVTPYVGTISLFVRYGEVGNATTPQTFSDTSRFPGNTVYIKATDPGFRTGFWYVNLVSTQTSLDSVLRVMAAQGIPTLEDSFPMIGSVIFDDCEVYRTQVEVHQGVANETIDVSCSVLKGRVDLTVGRDTTPEVNPIAKSRGPGSRNIVLRVSSILTTEERARVALGESVVVTLYVGVTGAVSSVTEYVVAVAGPVLVSDLVPGVPIENSVTGAGGFRKFQAVAPPNLGTLQIFLFQCDNALNFVPSTFYIGRDFQPTKDHSDGVSEQQAPAVSGMSFAHPGGESVYYFSVYPPNGAQNSEFSIMRVANDEHPFPAGGKVFLVNVNGTSMTVRWPESKLGDSTLHYSVYIAFEKDDSGNPNNMYTPCGCERNRFDETGFLTRMSFSPGKFGADQLGHQFFNLPFGRYVVTVVVRDVDGLMTVYERAGPDAGTVIVEPDFTRVVWGHETSSLVAAGKIANFAFAQNRFRDFVFTTTSYVGSTDTCLAHGSFPPPMQPGGGVYCSYTLFPGNWLHIPWLDRDYGAGPWYVSITADDPSQFGVVLSTAFDGFVTVTDGMTFTGYAAYNTMTHYRFPIKAGLPKTMLISFAAQLTVGEATMLIAASYPPDATTNYIVKETGHGDLYAQITVGQLPAGATDVWVGMIGEGSYYDNVYQLSIVTQNGTSDLLTNSPVERVVVPGTPSVFKSRVISAGHHVKYIIDSCDNSEAPVVYFSDDGKDEIVPSPQHHSAVSHPTASAHTSILEFSSYQAKGNLMRTAAYASGAVPNSFNVRLYLVDTLPVMPETGQVLIADDRSTDTTVTVRWPKASSLSPKYMEYSVFVGLYADKNGNQQQFSTYCAIENQKLTSSAYDRFPLIYKPGWYEYTFHDLDAKKNAYVFNVLVRNDLGYVIPYTKATYTHSHGYTSMGKMSGGSVFIIIAVCAIVLYVVAGVVVNLVQHKQGKDLLSHVRALRELPSLVSEGFLFLIHCGAKDYGEDTARLHPGEQTVEEEPGTELSARSPPEDAAQGQSGYGAI